MSIDTVFSVQDETGTVYQVVTDADTSTIHVGDTGILTGVPDDGTDGFAPPDETSANFSVSQVISGLSSFSIRTLTQATADWPRSGTITWLTGSNVNTTSTAFRLDPANAYIDQDFLQTYHASRGNAIPQTADDVAQRAAIVKATDYLDNRYRYKGIKLIQQLSAQMNDLNAAFIEPWLYSWTPNPITSLTPSTTPQFTEWPRQGVNDLNGDTVNGIPLAIKQACAELALRVLNGINLQPDYDPTIVTAGGVLQSTTKEVGPIKVTKTYDTKLGIGFFADFPQITRMLTQKGLLVPNRGRTVMR